MCILHGSSSLPFGAFATAFCHLKYSGLSLSTSVAGTLISNHPLFSSRIPCDKDRPELDARQSQCSDTPGCFFDRSLGDYRKRFGHSVMPGVPVCHLAIRNEVFLTEARKVETKVGSV